MFLPLLRALSLKNIPSTFLFALHPNSFFLSASNVWRGNISEGLSPYIARGLLNFIGTDGGYHEHTEINQERYRTAGN